LPRGIGVTDPHNQEDRSKDSGASSQWKTLGIYGAMGFEFVGFVVGGALAGMWLDEYFGTEPWGVVGLILLGMLAALWHVYLVTKRFLK
jgi:F0F1-type ATP synthase assembly protein I